MTNIVLTYEQFLVFLQITDLDLAAKCPHSTDTSRYISDLLHPFKDGL